MTLLAKLFRTLFILAFGFALGVGATIYFAATHKNGGGTKLGEKIGALLGGGGGGSQTSGRNDYAAPATQGNGAAYSNDGGYASGGGNFAGSAEEYFNEPGPAIAETSVRSKPAPRAAAKSTVRLLEFGAEWCGPCKVQDPIVASLAAEYAGEVSVVKIDIDKSPEIAQRYGIQGVPTLILEKNGKIAKRFMGLQQEDVLAAAFDDVLR